MDCNDVSLLAFRSEKCSSPRLSIEAQPKSISLIVSAPLVLEQSNIFSGFKSAWMTPILHKNEKCGKKIMVESQIDSGDAIQERATLTCEEMPTPIRFQ